MKKITFLVMAVMLSMGAAMAQDFSVGDVGYSRLGANGGVKVWGASTAFAGGAFNIPTTVVDPADSKTYNVTEIRAYFIGKFTAGKLPTSVTVPEGVVTFTAGVNGSFDAASGGAADILESITLPSTLTLTSFGAFTFRITDANAHKFKTFTIKMATPPTVEANTFYNFPLTELTIHIPAGKTADYSAAGWNTTTWPGVTIVEDVATSVKEVSAMDVKVMALSANSFAIAGLKGAATVRVMNLAGKLVAQFSNVNDNQTLSSSLLNKGVYIVSVSEGAILNNSKLVLF